RPRRPFAIRKALRAVRVYATIPLSLGALFYLASSGAQGGIRSSLQLSKPRTWMPSLLSHVGYSPFAEVEGEDISTKPPNWTGDETYRDQLSTVKGAILRSANLRFMNARRAFLVNADLEGADLSRAILSEADLRGANFRGASLIGADLRRTRLDGANFDRDTLNGATLLEATLYNLSPNFSSYVRL